MLRELFDQFKSAANRGVSFLLKLISSHPRIWFIGSRGTVLVGALGVGFLASYFIRLSDSPIFNLADRAGTKIAEMFQPSASGNADGANKTYSSTFVSLEGQVVSLPKTSTDRAAGSLTSWDDQLVTLSQDGNILIVKADRTVETPQIAAPANGFEDYAALSETAAYQDYTHRFDFFRYNDIAHVEVAEQSSLVVSYTKFHADRTCYTSALAQVFIEDLGSDTIVQEDDWQVIFETNPCLPLKDTWRAIEGHMAGGRMVFDGEETLYVTVGEYHWDGVYGPASVPGTSLPTSQDPESDYGRVIAVNLSNNEARHFSIGQRNMQGIAIDANGEVWTVEHGLRGGDELNRVVEGQNYGWPYETYGTLYSRLPIPGTISFGRHETYTKPAYSWLPSIATSGLTLVDGFHESWDGDLLASTLVGKQLVRIRIDQNRVVFTESISVGERIRYVHQHTDGSIVLYNGAGDLIFLSTREGGLGAEFVDKKIRQMDANDAFKSRLRTLAGTCAECHSYNRNEHRAAPSLAETYGARIGSTSFENYSSGMASASGRWTRDQLKAYLRAPNQVIPGTTMPEVGTIDEDELDALIDILEELEASAE